MFIQHLRKTHVPSRGSFMCKLRVTAQSVTGARGRISQERRNRAGVDRWQWARGDKVVRWQDASFTKSPKSKGTKCSGNQLNQRPKRTQGLISNCRRSLGMGRLGSSWSFMGKYCWPSLGLGVPHIYMAPTKGSLLWGLFLSAFGQRVSSFLNKKLINGHFCK